METQDLVDGPSLLLIDGLNIVRRCYEANPAPDSPEKAQATARTAFSSFRRALTENPHTHALAAFDFGGRTWRHDLYERYREKRKPMPDELRDILPAFRQRLTDDLGLAVVCVPGVEADDVIGTVHSHWVACKAAPVVVVSTDKDLCQLIASGARIRDHFKPEWRDAEWVFTKFGVPPEQLGDMLALMGDSSDDIPGVAGIGAKTAAKLLTEHGSLEALLAAAGSVKGKNGERLQEQAEMARLSRQLVELNVSVPVGVTWNSLRRHTAEAMAA